MGVCELCGKEGSLLKIILEGVAMGVCKGCSRFGKEIKRTLPQKQRILRFPKRQRMLEEPKVIEMLASDYSSTIRKKREKLGMKQEHLAKKMGIKESLIHKIESNSIWICCHSIIK